MITDNDAISTSELNSELRIKGFFANKGVYNLTQKDLQRIGLTPLVQLKNAVYWNRKEISLAEDYLTNKRNSKVQKDAVKKDISYASFNELCGLMGKDMYEIKQKLDLIIDAFDLNKRDKQ